MASVHGLLRAAVDRNPAQPVFVQQGRVTSYGELESASGRFAAGLRRLGIGRGQRIALVIDGDADYLVAYYGIVKAGAVVVPHSPDTRSGPLVHALAHSEAEGVILDAANFKYLAGQAAALSHLRVVLVRGEVAPADAGPWQVLPFQSLLDGSEELHDSSTGADDLLSITYTSGTTGRPKGVMLSHRCLVANVRSIVSYLELRADDRVAMVLPFYYVYGNSVLHTHVCAGATIVAAGSMAFPVAVLKEMQEHACTGFSGVPATFVRLLGVSNLAQFELGSLRYVTQAGAAMAPELASRVCAAFPQARVFVMYGQTEAAARLAYVPPDDLPRKPGSAGKAIPGVTLKIVDSEGRALPTGEVGEVVAQGENVMLGYWKDPEETARVLRADGLHTGDLGRLDEEGFLHLVGRQSELIKSGAHRISPAEIEAVIARVEGVLECAVTGVPDDLLGQAIAAFIVPQPGATLQRQAILRACFVELPRFKLPEHVIIVPELPRTPTGKLKRLELAATLFKPNAVR